MANTNTQGIGLQPTGVMGNEVATQGQSKYFIDAGDATAIYNGEAVKLTGGYIVTGAANITTNTLGTLNGVFYNATSTKKPTWNTYYPGGITPADSEDITAFVCDDPLGLWIGNFDAALGANKPAAVVATIGSTAGTGTSSGSTINGRSDVTLTQGTIAALANSWRVIRVVADPSNSDMTAAYCSVVVVQNLNQIIDSQ